MATFETDSATPSPYPASLPRYLAPRSMLCHVCVQIPLDAIFSRTSRSVFTIGDISEVRSRQYCVLCRLCKVYLESLAGNAEFQQWLALPSPCIFRLRSRTPLFYNGPPDDDADWMFTRMPLDVFLGSFASLELYKEGQWDYEKCSDRAPHFIVQDRLGAVGPSQLLTATDKGRFLSHASLQRIMRGALGCKQNHESCGGTIHPTRPSQKFIFRLIDVQDRTIRLADQHHQYVALSYRWGQSTRHEHRHLERLSMDPGVARLPENLPQTIQDVLQVTRWLGLRYVWIDAYCIQQDNPVELEEAVSNMDSVYENALLTICVFWADSDAGLHGVSLPFKDHNTQPLGENYICSSLPHRHPLDDEIIDTPWHQRGWIFQESILSRQRLCFMPSSVVLLCSKQNLNSHYYTRTGGEPAYRMAFSDIQLRGCLGKAVWDFGTYQNIVSSYTARTLSQPGDALRAIQGILNRITAQTGVGFLQGLPQADILNGLIWTRTSFPPGDTIWKTGMPECRRRFRFPSWSWLDHDGTASYDLWLTTPWRWRKTPKRYHLSFLPFTCATMVLVRQINSSAPPPRPPAHQGQLTSHPPAKSALNLHPQGFSRPKGSVPFHPSFPRRPAPITNSRIKSHRIIHRNQADQILQCFPQSMADREPSSRLDRADEHPAIFPRTNKEHRCPHRRLDPALLVTIVGERLRHWDETSGITPLEFRIIS